MKVIDKKQLMEDLKAMRKCADSYCPDHDCAHCKIAVDQDELIAVIDIVTSIVNSIAEQNVVCPISSHPCIKSCAWYDHVAENCVIMRRNK